MDTLCRASVAARPDSVVAWLLMASLAYYRDDAPILSDGCFDELCKGLAARWERVPHPHARLLTMEDLQAGSTFAIPFGDYPAIVDGALQRLRAAQLPPPPSMGPRECPGGATAKQMSLF